MALGNLFAALEQAAKGADHAALPALVAQCRRASADFSQQLQHYLDHLPTREDVT